MAIPYTVCITGPQRKLSLREIVFLGHSLSLFSLLDFHHIN